MQLVVVLYLGRLLPMPTLRMPMRQVQQQQVNVCVCGHADHVSLAMPTLRMRHVQQQLVSMLMCGHADHVSLAVFVILQNVNMLCWRWHEDISQLQREWIEAACYLVHPLTKQVGARVLEGADSFR